VRPDGTSLERPGQQGTSFKKGKAAMETMMALRAHARGGPEQLVYERAPRPVAGPGEVGGQVLADSFALLRRGGRLVTLGAPPDLELAARYGVHAMFFVVQPDRAELTRLAELADEGRLRPVVSQTFSLADGRQAYASRAQDRPPGKTVLMVR
jgi:NADPH:quinone reductase-like Zn-dependent oxidoreductase